MRLSFCPLDENYIILWSDSSSLAYLSEFFQPLQCSGGEDLVDVFQQTWSYVVRMGHLVRRLYPVVQQPKNPRLVEMSARVLDLHGGAARECT